MDLDQTVVHATVDPTVGEWIAEGQAWEAEQTLKKGGEETNINGNGEEHARNPEEADTGRSTTPPPPDESINAEATRLSNHILPITLRFMADEYDDTSCTVFPFLQTVLGSVRYNLFYPNFIEWSSI